MANAPVHCVALVRFANLGDECAEAVRFCSGVVAIETKRLLNLRFLIFRSG